MWEPACFELVLIITGKGGVSEASNTYYCCGCRVCYYDAYFVIATLMGFLCQVKMTSDALIGSCFYLRCMKWVLLLLLNYFIEGNAIVICQHKFASCRSSASSNWDERWGYTQNPNKHTFGDLQVYFCYLQIYFCRSKHVKKKTYSVFCETIKRLMAFYIHIEIWDTPRFDLTF